MLGSVLEVEDPALVGYRGFLRMRIDLDARKPLPTCCLLPCRSSTKKIRLQFELLKNFCFRCGRLGHMISVCNYQVHPLLIARGVVYDLSLVAEPIQKPAFTLPHHPLEFPYLPKPDLRHTTRRNNSDKTKIQIEPVIVPSTLHLSLPRTDSDLPSASSLPTAPSDSSDPRVTPSDLSSVSLSVPIELSSGTMAHRKRLDLWHPDTNGTMFRNGSITMAINGIKLDSPSWADPNVIPPWAFKNLSEYERANPFYPVPGFDNDTVLVPLPLAQSLENVETCLTFEPTPPIVCTQRKRRGKRPSNCGTEVSSTAKKARPLLSPSLRLSNNRGGRRGGRTGYTYQNGSCSRGRGLSSRNELRPSTSTGIFLVSENSQFVSGDAYTSSLASGMEDVTHPQGCGGWPKSAARGQ